MRDGTVTQLVDEIEILAEAVKASPAELMAALSIIIVENLNAHESNILKVDAGEQRLLITLEGPPPARH
ncbi:hypothetical protein [Candidatus Pantoea floridensis]|uniref:Uncharacterized protein n=1 Tax=Candidatus Pantoea floridensis TaxID=1938870 RepID=A0A286DSB3_9GAMM|nr:hypothetical protein [Pantoea floridensis]PIF06933.1 hypothetical protein BX596_5234 [Enterobacteriaceae bacterium JKS000233]SOD61535.1 hypothetical protein SAMN06273570_5185 [Pantoea floridensis]